VPIFYCPAEARAKGAALRTMVSKIVSKN